MQWRKRSNEKATCSSTFRKFLAIWCCWSLVSIVCLPAAVSSDLSAASETNAAASMPAISPALTSTNSGSGTAVLVNSNSVDLSTLNVPSGSTLVLDFGNQASISLAGNLNNAGSIYAISSNSGLSTVSISANNILNNNGALISTVLPANGIAGLPLNLGSLVQNLSINLTALQNIVNAGTISSAGNLSMVAGNTITNALPAGVAGMSPVMTAMQNINMQAANIVNSGQISSNLASINAYTANLTNTLGVIEAMNGSLSILNVAGNSLAVNNLLGSMSTGNQIATEAIKHELSTPYASLSVLGGDLAAPRLSFVAADGKINVNVNSLDGSVMLSGADAGVNVDHGNLRIAASNLSGDPIFASPGQLDLSGLFVGNSTFFTRGADLVALAGGDIIAQGAPSNALISAGADQGPGGKIVLNSGVQYTLTNPGCLICNSQVDYQIAGTSQSGGSIILPQVSLITADNNISLTANSGCNSSGSISIGDVRICHDCQGGYNEQQLNQPIEANVEQNHLPNVGNIFLKADGNIYLHDMLTIPGGISICSRDGIIGQQSGSVWQAFGGDIVTTGNLVLMDALVNAVNGSLLASSNGFIEIGNSSLNASSSPNGYNGGDLRLFTNGTINSCGDNSFTASGGDISIYAGRLLRTGKTDSFVACAGGNCGQNGGDITLTAGCGPLLVGSGNGMNANGGSISLKSLDGDVVVGDRLTANAFGHNNRNSGNINIEACNGDIFLGDSGNYNAAGGDIGLIAGGDIATGCDNKFNAFSQPGFHHSWYGGDIKFTANKDIRLGIANNFNAAGGDIDFFANKTLRTAAWDQFLACAGGNCGESGGNVLLKSNWGPLFIDRDNTINANGGSIGITSFHNDISVADRVQANAFRNGKTNAGNVNLTACDGDISLGKYGNYNAVGGDICMQAGDDIVTDYHNNFNAFAQTVHYHSYGGDIKLVAGDDIYLGTGNNLTASGGNIDLAAHDRLYTGLYDRFLACAGGNCGQSGGDIHFTSVWGPIAIGSSNQLLANGGSIVLQSNHDDIAVGDRVTANAFSQDRSSADVVFNACDGDVKFGKHGTYNAVGGDIKVSAGESISSGTKNDFNAFAPSNRHYSEGGNVMFEARKDIHLQGSNRFNAAGGNIGIAAGRALSTGSFDKFLACGGDGCGRSGGSIGLSSDRGPLCIGYANQMKAVGGSLTMDSLHGDIIVGDRLSANAFRSDNGGLGDIGLDAHRGDLKLGNYGDYQAVGGDIKLHAGDTIKTSYLNDFAAFAQQNRHGSVGGDICLDAGKNVYLGSRNQLTAVGGDITLFAGSNVSTGSADKFLACAEGNCGNSGGSIRLMADCGNTRIGYWNELTAKGGSIAVWSKQGDVAVDDKVTANAYGNGQHFSGNVSLIASGGDLRLGKDGHYNAVGGDLQLAANHKLETDHNNSFNAFAQVGDHSYNGGNLCLTAGEICLGSGNNFSAAGGDIGIAAECKLTTGAWDKFVACAGANCGNSGGNIRLVSEFGPLQVSSNNQMSADGGSISIVSLHNQVNVGNHLTASAFSHGRTSAGNIYLLSQDDDVHVGDSNTFNAVGVSVLAGGDLKLGNYGQFNASGGGLDFSADHCLSVGDHNQFNAFGSKGDGGNVNFEAGNVLKIGDRNGFDAVGGDINLSSHEGEISLGSSNILQALAACSDHFHPDSTGGNINVESKYDVSLDSNNKMEGVGGDINIASSNGGINSQYGNKFCTFSGGDISIASKQDINAQGQYIDADGSVVIASGAMLNLSASTAIARDDSLTLKSGNCKDITLDNNTLVAQKNVDIMSDNDLYTNMSLFSGDNHICSIKGDVKLGAHGDIELGLGDHIEANEGAVTLSAHDNVSLGALGLISAGKGDLEISSSRGSISLGNGNKLNAFGYKVGRHSSRGGNIMIAAQRGLTYAGNFNRLSAVGGKIKVDTAFVLPGFANRYCTFNNDGHADLYPQMYVNGRSVGYDFRCTECVKPDKPGCELPARLCEVPTAPVAPLSPSCPDLPLNPQPLSCERPPAPPDCKLTPPTPICDVPRSPRPPFCELTPPKPLVCDLQPPAPPACPQSPDVPECELPPIPPLPTAELMQIVVPEETTPTASVQPFLQIPALNLYPNNYIWTVSGKKETYFEKLCNSPSRRHALLSHGVSLKDGQSVVQAGENGETVTLENAVVHIPAGGVAVIQTAAEDKVGVISMTDSELGVVSVNVQGQGVFDLKTGEQLVIEYAGPESPEYRNANEKPGDFVAQQSAALPKVMKVVTLMPQEVPYEMIWNSTPHHIGYWLPTHRHGAIGGALARGEVLSDASGVRGTPATNADNDVSSSSNLRPMSFTQTSKAFRLQNPDIRISKGTRIKRLADGNFKMTEGSAVFAKQSDLQVYTPNGTVLISGDAVASITVKQNMIVVRDLYDQSHDDVKVIAKNAEQSLRPGRECAVIAAPEARCKDLLYSDRVGRRKIESHRLGKGTYMLLSDVSHVNLLLMDNNLRDLRLSNKQRDRNLLSKLEKMAAVITTVCDRTRGPYVIPYRGANSRSLAVEGSHSEL